MKLISVVPTPNPDALKFTLGEELLKQGSRSFTSSPSAANDPLASKLFAIHGVTSVFYMSNFITVNKNKETPWSDLENRIQDILTASESPTKASEDKTLLKKDGADSSANFRDMTPAQKILAIDKILDDEIRPGLAGDGGGLEIVGLEDNVLQVHYEGACGSCPSSTSGTLQYIESMVRSHLDDSLKVVPV